MIDAPAYFGPRDEAIGTGRGLEAHEPARATRAQPQISLQSASTAAAWPLAFTSG